MAPLTAAAYVDKATVWVVLTRDSEDRAQFPSTSEVPERFEGQHMWQMDAKLEAPSLLYFHSVSPFPSLHCGVRWRKKENVCEINYKSVNISIKVLIVTIPLWSIWFHVWNHTKSRLLCFSGIFNKLTECSLTVLWKVGRTCRRLLSSITVFFHFFLSHKHFFLCIFLDHVSPSGLYIYSVQYRRVVSLFLGRRVFVSDLKRRSSLS